MRYFGSKKLKKLFYSYLCNFELEDGAMGWGRKPSFFRAQNISSKFDIPLYCLEDGFIRSLGLGKDGFLPLSLVVDTHGIYFDAFQTSKSTKIDSSSRISRV